MEIIFITFLLLLFIGILFLAIRLIKWILQNKVRSRVALVLLVIGIVVQIINHLFFKNMMFIQSEVYPNLYLVKYPEKDQSILHQAIREKVTKHLKKGFATEKKLAYQKEDSILFYKYYKAFPFSVFQDEGTAYFLENEEDLGGLVTEELGMYSKYKLAEFDYSPCKANVTLECGKFSFFNKGNLINKPNRQLNKNVTISDVEEPLDNTTAIPQIKLAFSTKNEVLFLNLFPNSFQEFVSYFGWNEHSDSPSQLYNESYSYITYFFELISNEKYKNYEKKLINIAKNGKWQADAVNYFQDKSIKYIKKKQRYNLINNLEFNEAKSVLFFLFDGPHPQFDKKFTHSFNNHKMHIIYDLFANEFKVEENKKNPISKDISYYLDNKNYFVRDIDINNDYALDKVVSSAPYQEDELLLFINKDGAYQFALKTTNFSEDGGKQIVDVLAEEKGFFIQTTFPDRGFNEANYHITFKNTHWVLTNTLFRVKESNEKNSSIYICNVEQELDFSDPNLLEKMKGIPNEDERKNVVQSNKMGKLILEYALWTVVALIFGIGYMYLIFLTFGGSFEEETNVVSFIYSKMIFLGLLYMGLAIGSILAVLFIILDIFYLKRKLKYSKHKFIIRVFFMLFILAFMSPIHYILEKTLDWI